MNGIHVFWNCHLSCSHKTLFVFSAQVPCSKPSDLVLNCWVGRALIVECNKHIIIFLVKFSCRKRYFITAQHSFAVKSQLFWIILNSNIKYSGFSCEIYVIHIQNNKLLCNEIIISINVGTIRKVKDLSAHLCNISVVCDVSYVVWDYCFLWKDCGLIR
jgi:hypothetical protein